MGMKVAYIANILKATWIYTTLFAAYFGFVVPLFKEKWLSQPLTHHTLWLRTSDFAILMIAVSFITYIVVSFFGTWSISMVYKAEKKYQEFMNQLKQPSTTGVPVDLQKRDIEEQRRVS